ncbi:MAG: hypothetical protein OEL84_07250 [Nitrosopumilus sp.]|nr:hypothetical protein [Nitrosopumilus sp.]MDH3341065.1 hypothetical protein [Nitrosopumilus sp.]
MKQFLLDLLIHGCIKLGLKVGMPGKHIGSGPLTDSKSGPPMDGGRGIP